MYKTQKEMTCGGIAICCEDENNPVDNIVLPKSVYDLCVSKEQEVLSVLKEHLETKFYVPEEIRPLIREAVALNETANELISKDKVKIKKIVTLKKKAEKYKDQFWEGVRYLYPELENVGLVYSNGYVTIKRDR